MVLTILSAKNWVSHPYFSIYRYTCSLCRITEMYRRLKKVLTNNWLRVFVPAVPVNLDALVLSTVQLTFSDMLSHPTVKFDSKKRKRISLNIVNFQCLHSQENCFASNVPFVLQSIPCPNIVAIQKHTPAFCGREFA